MDPADSSVRGDREAFNFQCIKEIDHTCQCLSKFSLQRTTICAKGPAKSTILRGHSVSYAHPSEVFGDTSVDRQDRIQGHMHGSEGTCGKLSRQGKRAVGDSQNDANKPVMQDRPPTW
eukprot:275898-Amphidinium_carterae.1